MDLAAAKYIFAIATRGGTTCHAFDQIDKLLKNKGRRLDSYFVLTMPSGSDPLVEEYANHITEERIAKLESEMQERLNSIQEIVVTRKVNQKENLQGTTPPPTFLKPFMPIIDFLGPHLVPLGKLAESRFGFYADSKCTGCGVCERVCLAQKITIVDKRPVWQEKVKCLGCFACLNYCPEQSVQVKSTWYLKSWTTKNGRYHHPEITAQDIARQKQSESTPE